MFETLLLWLISPGMTQAGYPNVLTEENFVRARSLPILPKGMTVEQVWDNVAKGELAKYADFLFNQYSFLSLR